MSSNYPMYQNPVVITVQPSNGDTFANGTIRGTTNCGFSQKAIVTVTDANNNTIASGTLSGKGEGNQVMTVDGSGTTSLKFTNGQLPITITINCEYWPNPNGFTPYQNNQVMITQPYNVAPVSIYMVQTEDSNDGDWNDMILTIPIVTSDN